MNQKSDQTPERSCSILHALNVYFLPCFKKCNGYTAQIVANVNVNPESKIVTRIQRIQGKVSDTILHSNAPFHIYNTNTDII